MNYSICMMVGQDQKREGTKAVEIPWEIESAIGGMIGEVVQVAVVSLLEGMGGLIIEAGLRRWKDLIHRMGILLLEEVVGKNRECMMMVGVVAVAVEGDSGREGGLGMEVQGVGDQDMGMVQEVPVDLEALDLEGEASAGEANLLEEGCDHNPCMLLINRLVLIEFIVLHCFI